MSARVKLPIHMSVDDFLAWESGDRRPWQLVDGVPEAMAPTNRTHGALQSRLASLLDSHFERRGSPCSVITAPGVIPHVQARHNVRIPDLGVTCSPYTEEQSLLADPVLLVEILSPSNQAETWSNVWTYTTIPSVREILVLRGASVGAELLRRQADGTWPPEPLSITDGALVLESVGLRVPLADIYRTTRLRRTDPPAGS